MSIYFTFKIHSNIQSIIQNIITLSYSTEQLELSFGWTVLFTLHTYINSFYSKNIQGFPVIWHTAFDLD